VLAIVALRLFRRPLLAWLQPAATAPVDSMVAEVAVPLAPIEAGQHGRAELRGTAWAVHNVGSTAVAAGQRCRVVAVSGLQLDIRPE
jgi:membrane protein implicated in regulation of membrane protease activity